MREREREKERERLRERERERHTERVGESDRQRERERKKKSERDMIIKIIKQNIIMIIIKLVMAHKLFINSVVSIFFINLIVYSFLLIPSFVHVYSFIVKTTSKFI